VEIDLLDLLLAMLLSSLKCLRGYWCFEEGLYLNEVQHSWASLELVKRVGSCPHLKSVSLYVQAITVRTNPPNIIGNLQVA